MTKFEAGPGTPRQSQLARSTATATAALCLLFGIACDSTQLEPVKRRRCEQDIGTSSAANASAFLDSLGFHARLNERLTPGPDGLTPAHHLRALAVRHLRDGTIDDARITDVIAQSLAADGIKLLYQLSLQTDFGKFWPTTRGFVEAVQVPSPANDFLGPNAYAIEEVPPAAARLRTSVEALAEPERPFVVGPIIFQEADFASVGDLSAWIDYGGFRASIGDVEPARTYAGWAQKAQVVSGGKPLMATKLTYLTIPSEAGMPGLTPDLQAKYIVRMLLESFNRGVVRTYYEHIYDSACEEAFCRGGLIFADGTPKPAYQAWKTLVDVLRAGDKDTSNAPPRHLSYRLESTVPDDLHTTLLQRHDGAFVLVLWLEVPGTNGQDITQAVTLSLGGPDADVTAVDLRAPMAPPERLGPGPTYTLTISDAPLLLTIRPTCE